MSDAQYYRIELDDYAAPSFTSFGKSYFGTFDDVRSFISALENDPEDGKNYAELMAEINDGRHRITLCHYPMMSWNRCNQGAFHIHGHSPYGLTPEDWAVMCMELLVFPPTQQKSVTLLSGQLKQQGD